MAKNKSVAQVANLENKQIQTRYEEHAKNLGNGYIQVGNNSKGEQVRDALNKVTEGLNRAGAAHAKIEAQKQADAAKAHSELKIVESLKAKNAVVRHTPSLKDFVENFEFVRDEEGNLPSQEVVFDAWRGKDDYAKDIARITHPLGQQYVQQELGTILSTAYGEASLTYEKRELLQELDTNLGNMINNPSAFTVDPTQPAPTIYQTIEAWDTNNKNVIGPQERYETILSNAERHAIANNGDFSGYEYLTFNNIGGKELKQAIIDSKKKVNVELYNKEQKEEAARKKKQVIAKNKLQTELYPILRINPNADVTHIVEKYVADGLGDAQTITNAAIKAHSDEKSRDRVLTAQQENEYTSAFYSIVTPQGRQAWLDTRVNILPTELSQRLRPYVNEIDSYYNDPVFTKARGNFKNLIGEDMDLELHEAVVAQFGRLYADYYDSEQYKTDGMGAREQAARTLRQEAMLMVNDNNPDNETTEERLRGSRDILEGSSSIPVVGKQSDYRTGQRVINSDDGIMYEFIGKHFDKSTPENWRKVENDK